MPQGGAITDSNYRPRPARPLIAWMKPLQQQSLTRAPLRSQTNRELARPVQLRSRLSAPFFADKRRHRVQRTFGKTGRPHTISKSPFLVFPGVEIRPRPRFRGE